MGRKVPESDRDYILGLLPAIAKIGDEGIREKVIRTWHRAWKQSNFSRIEDGHQFEPARDYIAYTNVEHTNQVCQACEKMAAISVEILKLRVNMDYLLAGALLHDVDKLVIFDFQTGGFTEIGRKTSHAVAGAALARAEGLPAEVAHMIDTHSTNFSSRPPGSAEALILRQADLLVAHSVYLAHGLEMEKVLNESLTRKTW
ncbi:MAG: HD domain-containing protein [Deltaproteobacteria bacterium]|nr:HD domain-containing protein [Deltaproteobacteria bacterium]